MFKSGDHRISPRPFGTGTWPEENPKDAGEVDQDGWRRKAQNEVINRGGTSLCGTSKVSLFLLLKTGTRMTRI